MRTIIIGAGSIAYRHAAACRDLENADLVAVCDVRRSAADALADQFGVSARYSDLDALLAENEADLAIVATWGAFHAEVVERLARSGRVRAILCEKPLAMNGTQAEAMFKVAADTGVLLAEAFRLRNQPIHHRAVELIRSGRIGHVVHVRNAMMWSLPAKDKDPARNWRFDKAVGGGVTFDIGCYCINQLRWAMGDEPETVHAVGRWGPTGVDEHVVALATFAGGRTAEWCVSWQAGPAHVAEVLGTDGTLRIQNAWGDGPATATVLEITDSRRAREVEEFAPTDQFWLQLQHMQDCLQNGSPHRIPPADSIAQMRVIDAVYESLAIGTPARVVRA
ncbi:MAG: Gfo/Idh/MocA family protein [Chloroflexota bacterium]